MSLIRNEEIFKINEELKNIEANTLKTLGEQDEEYLDIFSSRMSSVLDGSSDDSWSDDVRTEITSSIEKIVEYIEEEKKAARFISGAQEPVDNLKTICESYITEYDKYTAKLAGKPDKYEMENGSYKLNADGDKYVTQKYLEWEKDIIAYERAIPKLEDEALNIRNAVRNYFIAIDLTNNTINSNIYIEGSADLTFDFNNYFDDALADWLATQDSYVFNADGTIVEQDDLAKAEYAKLLAQAAQVQSDADALEAQAALAQSEEERARLLAEAQALREEKEQIEAQAQALMKAQIQAVTQAVQAAQENLTNAQTEFATAESNLTNAQTEFATAESNLTNAQTEFEPAESNLTVAQDDFNAKLQELESIQYKITVFNNLSKAKRKALGFYDENDPAVIEFRKVFEYDGLLNEGSVSLYNLSKISSSLNSQYKTAQTEYAAAESNLTNAQTTYSTAQDNLTNAQTAYSTAQDNLANAQIAYGKAQGKLESAQTAYSMAEQTLAQLQSGSFATIPGGSST